MANIYQIRKEIESFEFECDPETGELLNGLSWDELNMAFEEKIENIACCIKNLNSDIAAFKAEEEALAARRKSAQKKAEYLKKLLADNMGGQKFSSPKCAVSFRTSEVVEVEDVKLLPANMVKEKKSFEPDKASIKASIKSGQEVPGCRLVENLNVQIK